MYAKQLLLITVTLFFYLHPCEKEAAENLKKALTLSSTPDTNRTKIMLAGACVISSVLGTAYCWKKLFEVQEDSVQEAKLINVEPFVDLFSQSSSENLYPHVEKNQQNIANKKIASTILGDFIKVHKNKLKVIGGITVGTLLSIHFAKKYMTECLTFDLIDNYYEYAIKFCNDEFEKARKISMGTYLLGRENITTGIYYILKKFFRTGKL